MTESIDWNDGDEDAEDTPQQPRGGYWRRLRRTRSATQAPEVICRPVSVLGADGEPVHATVLGDAPMSDESRAAFGEIVRAAQRRHVAELRAEREAADDDVRAVRALTNAASRMLGTWAEANDDVRRELWTTLHDRADVVFDRFRERYAELDAKAGEQR